MKKNKILFCAIVSSLLTITACSGKPSENPNSENPKPSEIITPSVQESTDIEISVVEPSEAPSPSVEPIPIDDRFTVMFDTDGGTTIPEIKTKEAINLQVPFKYGYRFAGWYDGDIKIEGETYTPTKSVILKAKYEKITYLYLYYGLSTDHKRLEYEPGSNVKVSDLFQPDPVELDGNSFNFIKWTYEDGSDVPTNINIGNDTVILVADYGEVRGKPKNKITIYDDGSMVTTGSVAMSVFDEESQYGCVEATLRFAKGSGGSSNVAFRMSMSGNDYAYEDVGSTYLAVGIVPATGNVQFASVLDGKFSHFQSVANYASLPKAWRDIYDAFESECVVNVKVVVLVNEYYVYFNNIEINHYVGSLASYPGTGYGLRCSTTGCEYSNFKYESYSVKKVSFETNGGTACQTIDYLVGSISLPATSKEGYALEGWYYDEELTNKVDPNNFACDHDLKLYANWTQTFKKVTLITNGGTTISEPVNYYNGALILPEVTRRNYNLKCWCYDEELTQPVDLNNFICDGDMDIYAKWGLKETYMSADENGVYSASRTAAGIFGEAEDDVYQISSKITIVKGAGGGVGLAWRFGSDVDYPYETKGSNTNYISADLVPASGNLQVCYVLDGYFNHFATPVKSPIALSKLPQSWINKFNNAAKDEEITTIMTIREYGDKFEIYLDGALCATYDDATVLSKLTDKGYGFRSSSTSASYTAVKLSGITDFDSYTIKFNSNGGSNCEDIVFSGGAVELPKPTKSGSAFIGWYYDEELTQEVDPSNVIISGDFVILYAKWVEEFNMVNFVTYGGESIEPMVYYGQNVTLPIGKKNFYKFDGWYYDEEFSNIVDANHFICEDDMNIYGKFIPISNGHVVDNGDGTHKSTVKCIDFYGSAEDDCYVITQQFHILKGSGGGVGIAWRMEAYVDDPYETPGSGTYYLSVDFVPGTGNIQVCSVTNGTFGHLKGSAIAFDKTAQEWQDFYSQFESGEYFDATMTIKDYGDRFEAYINDVLIYEFADEVTLSSFTGTGYGVRSSSLNTTWKAPTYSAMEAE